MEKQKVKILFSPIGTTDPISNFTDGSMLHICRFYQPDIIYLYLSKEMCDFHKADLELADDRYVIERNMTREKSDRYQYCIYELGKLLGHDFEVRWIFREDLVDDVNKFDFFIDEFLEKIEEIYAEYRDQEEVELLLNVSSGTPAMKSALQTIAALAEYPLIPIQVGTPNKGYNPHSENKKTDNYREYWEANEDNGAKVANRCQVSSHKNLSSKIKKKMLVKLIQEYDYVGARILAQNITGLSQKVSDFLEGACARIKLDYHEADRRYKINWQCPVLPVADGDKVLMVEYMLWMNLKLQKEEYADFLRGATPIIVKIFEKILEKQCGIRISDYLSNPKGDKKERRWDSEKLRKNPEIWSRLAEYYKEGFKGTHVYSDHLVALASHMKNGGFYHIMGKIRDFENARNEVAHEIVPVTKEWLKKNKPEKMFTNLKKVLGFAGIQISDADWQSYDNMNRLIIDELSLP